VAKRAALAARTKRIISPSEVGCRSGLPDVRVRLARQVSWLTAIAPS
jgi:hypothetical protein